MTASLVAFSPVRFLAGLAIGAFAILIAAALVGAWRQDRAMRQDRTMGTGSRRLAEHEIGPTELDGWPIPTHAAAPSGGPSDPAFRSDG